jgi:HD-like signal output (HDOD) protein
MSEMTLTQQVNEVIATLSKDIKNNKLALPSPPDLIINIRALIVDQNTTADDIAALIKQDPHIAGRLIKVANSALFGARQHVTDVKSAVSRLGLSRVQNLVIGLSIAQNMMKAKTRELDDYFKQCWQQSNHVAAISYVLAQHKSTIDPEQALLAGMVHNIGALPLILRLNSIPDLKNNAHVLKMVADIVIPKLYASAGSLVMKSWNFAPNIISIALSHRDLARERKGPIDLDDIVLIAHQLDNSLSNITQLDELPEKVLNSAVFKKLWSDREKAIEELTQYKVEIDQMKQSIGH